MLKFIYSRAKKRLVDFNQRISPPALAGGNLLILINKKD